MRARSWIATLSGTALLATIGVVGVVGSSSANASGPPSGGTVTLNTNDGTITYAPPTGTSTTTQAFGITKSTGCLLATTLPDDTNNVITFGTGTTAAPAFVGYDPPGNKLTGGSIGVASANKTTGTACSQVNADAAEQLTLQLNTGLFPTFMGTPARATSTSMDLQVKSNAVVQAQFYVGTPSDTNVPVDTHTLLTGTNQVPTPPSGSDNCSATVVSDSGPDAGSSDNCYWTVTTAKPFDTVVLTPLTGTFSLEGGSDWGKDASTHRTIFNLTVPADGVLDCTDTITQNTTLSSGITGVAITRLPNGNGKTTGSGCVPLYYDLTVDGTATFHKSASQDPTAQFTVAIQRKFAVPSTTNLTLSSPVTPLKGNWEYPASTTDPVYPASTDFTIPFCTGPAFSGSANFANYSAGTFAYRSAGPTAPIVSWSAMNTSSYDMAPTQLPYVQYACVYAQSSELDPTTDILTTYDFVYLTGDFKFTP